MEKNRHSVIPRTGCLIFHQGKLLLIKYSKKKLEREGWYNWIGGHIEQGEGIIESAKREIQEETGLTVDVTLKGIIHVSNYFGKNFMLYLTLSTAQSDYVKNNDEGTLHRVSPEELDNYKIFKDIKVVLNEIRKLKDGDIFTAKSKFDGEGELISFEIE